MLGPSISHPVFLIQDGELVVNLDIGLSVASGYRTNSEFEIGEITKYAPHVDSQNGAVERNGIYEEVYAHEIGHANSFFTDFLTIFERYLYQYIVPHMSLWNENQINNNILQCYELAKHEWLPLSYAAANGATYGWFLNHKEWHYIGVTKEEYDGKLRDFNRWIKE